MCVCLVSWLVGVFFFLCVCVCFFLLFVCFFFTKQKFIHNYIPQETMVITTKPGPRQYLLIKQLEQLDQFFFLDFFKWYLKNVNWIKQFWRKLKDSSFSTYNQSLCLVVYWLNLGDAGIPFICTLCNFLGEWSTPAFLTFRSFASITISFS